MKNLFGIYTYPPAKQFGLQTKYSDFRDYIWNNNREFYEQLTKYIFEEDLWNDFENALGSFDDGEIKEMSEAAYLNYDDNYYNYGRAISDELEFFTKILCYENTAISE